MGCIKAVGCGGSLSRRLVQNFGRYCTWLNGVGCDGSEMPDKMGHYSVRCVDLLLCNVVAQNCILMAHLCSLYSVGSEVRDCELSQSCDVLLYDNLVTRRHGMCGLTTVA